MAKRRPTIMIVDDQKLISDGFKDLLLHYKMASEVICFETPDEAITYYTKKSGQRPDIVIMDILFQKKKTGIQAIKDLKAIDPDVKILAVSQCEDAETIQGALKAGARSYVTKQDGRDIMFDALRSVIAGDDEPYYPKNVSDQLMAIALDTVDDRYNVSKLDDIDKKVLELYAYGLSPKSISKEMSIMEPTVRARYMAIKNKTGLRQLPHLVMLAEEMGLIDRANYFDKIKEYELEDND